MHAWNGMPGSLAAPECRVGPKLNVTPALFPSERNPLLKTTPSVANSISTTIRPFHPRSGRYSKELLAYHRTGSRRQAASRETDLRDCPTSRLGLYGGSAQRLKKKTTKKTRFVRLRKAFGNTATIASTFCRFDSSRGL